MFDVLSQIEGAVTAGGVVASGLYTLWRSIRHKLEKQDEARETRLTKLESNVIGAFKEHELLDQSRHTDNLKAFEQIRMLLARKGLWNDH